MATTKLTLLLLLLPIFTVLLLAAAVSARPGIPFHPCNTLIISTYSFSLHPQNPSNPNLNPDFVFMDLRPVRFPFLGHDLRPLHPRHRLRHHYLNLHRPNFIRNAEITTTRPTEMTDLPLGFSSLRDRTKDILSVVASLLFGAACGALTAGTMYLIWSLLNYRHGNNYNSLDGFTSDDDDDDDDIFNPKKSHYVAIPAAAPVKEKEADSATPAAAKETV